MSDITLEQGFKEKYNLIKECFTKEKLYEFFWESLRLEEENNEVPREREETIRDYTSNKAHSEKNGYFQ